MCCDIRTPKGRQLTKVKVIVVDEESGAKSEKRKSTVM
jgi:hypothetical protein